MNKRSPTEDELRDPKANPAPIAQKTNPGNTDISSQPHGSEKVVGTDTDLLSPKDDTPGKIEKKDGPSSGQARSDKS